MTKQHTEHCLVCDAALSLDSVDLIPRHEAALGSGKCAGSYKVSAEFQYILDTAPITNQWTIVITQNHKALLDARRY